MIGQIDGGKLNAVFIDKNGQVVDCVTVFMPADELDVKIEALLK